MKRFFWILPLLYWWAAEAQTVPLPSRTFEITSSGSVMDISRYERALEHSFLDRYRALDYRTLMHFAEGVVVELYSALELQELGVPVNLTVLNSVPTVELKFTVIPPGRIVKWTPQISRP